MGFRDIQVPLVRILNHCHSSHLVKNTLSNLQYYKNSLQWVPTKTIDISQTIEYDICGKLRTFCSTTPCIIPCPKNYDFTYMVNVRYVNYSVNEYGVYTHNEKLISVNQCLFLDASFSVLQEKWIECTDKEDKYYVGVEDIRLFERNGTLWFIGTGLLEREKLGLKFGVYTPDKPLIPREMTCSFQKHCEKNWCFVPLLENVEQKETIIVYHWYPLQLCRLINDDKDKDATIELVRTMEMPLFFKNVRGSTCGFAYNQEIWFVVHLVSYEGTNEYPNKRSYYHSLVVFDETMTQLKRYSAPFTIKQYCIEFCLGLIVEENRVILSYSTMDRTSHISMYDKTVVEERLCFS